MKILLEFDHSKKDFFSAINSDIDGDQANEEINKLAKIYMKSDDITKHSQLAELIHKELPYDVILFIATYSLRERIEDNITKQMMRNFLNMDDDE
jgi:hypothetical protein